MNLPPSTALSTELLVEGYYTTPGSAPCHIGLGNEHNGTPVLILVADLNVRVITQDGQLLRDLVLDPTRGYQRRGVKPGPKPRPT